MCDGEEYTSEEEGNVGVKPWVAQKLPSLKVNESMDPESEAVDVLAALSERGGRPTAELTRTGGRDIQRGRVTILKMDHYYF